jgi:alpha-methylacyl-CoA racemase
MDRNRWPELKQTFAAVFKTKTRDEWCRIMEGTDVCFAPVLSIAEAPRHPQAEARGAYVDVDGVRQPSPAPRFTRTPATVQSAAPRRGAHTDAVLGELGLTPAEVQELRDAGVVV